MTEPMVDDTLVEKVARAIAAVQIDAMLRSVGIKPADTEARSQMIERDYQGWLEEAKAAVVAIRQRGE